MIILFSYFINFIPAKKSFKCVLIAKIICLIIFAIILNQYIGVNYFHKYFNHIDNSKKYHYFVKYVYIWSSFYLVNRIYYCSNDIRNKVKLKDTKPNDVKKFIFNKKYYIGTVDYGLDLEV